MKTLLQNPLAQLLAALLLGALLGWLLLRPHPLAPTLSTAERKHLERMEALLQAKASADSLRVAPLLNTAATHYATANRLYYEKLPVADSAARLRYLDSAVATW